MISTPLDSCVMGVPAAHAQSTRYVGIVMNVTMTCVHIARSTRRFAGEPENIGKKMPTCRDVRCCPRCDAVFT